MRDSEVVQRGTLTRAVAGGAPQYQRLLKIFNGLPPVPEAVVHEPDRIESPSFGATVFRCLRDCQRLRRVIERFRLISEIDVKDAKSGKRVGLGDGIFGTAPMRECFFET